MRDTTWGEVATLKYGKALRDYSKSDRTTGPVRVYGTNGPVGFTDAAQADGPAVIIGRKGAYRGVHFSAGPFWVIDTAYYLDHGSNIDPMWAYYALRNTDINSLGSGSAIPSTTREDFYALPVRIPKLREQRAIAEVLGALDDKIAANTRLVETLDALRRAHLQPMLEDAEPQPLSDIADFVNGRAFTKNASGTGRVVIRIAELNSGLGGSTVYNDIDVDDKHVARPGDLLFAWSGSLTVHRWYRAEAIVNQHIFKVIPKDGYPMWLVNGVLLRKLAEFRAIAADKATTMGHIQRRHLDEPVLVPRGEVIEREDRLMSGLWQRALAAEMESERLASTRDALLPLLMSGRVTVRDAESVVEEAV